MKLSFISTALLGILLGGPVYANRLTSLERFVLEELAGKASLAHTKMAPVDFKQQIIAELQTEARLMLGDSLEPDELEFVLSLVPEPPKKQEFVVPPKPKGDEVVKKWIDVTLDGKVQKIWAWHDPKNPSKILYIPGDKPDAERIPKPGSDEDRQPVPD